MIIGKIIRRYSDGMGDMHGKNDGRAQMGQHEKTHSHA